MPIHAPTSPQACSCNCAPPLSLMTTNMRASLEAHSPDLQPRHSASSSLARMSLPVNKTSNGVQSSETWTSSSGDLGGLSDTDDITERNEYIEEYNRLAKKYGIRPLVPDTSDHFEPSSVLHKRGWWSRTFRRTSSQSTEHSLRRQRSTSHVMSHLAHPKRDSLKDQDLQGLVRLCGKSFLYMPPEYAPGSLILPTCFRATAQFLIQHAPETRGVFRIPGSIRVVNELYEFYCAEQSVDVASTVRCPNLPAHINAGVHDVASCFKKFLSGLPGGVLGSLSLFDAMIAINSQLCGHPEFSRTKQSKIRARLIALAVSTLRSQFRRELICAVFGLLCLLGRAAETAPREDEVGRPLPTADLMGYSALGIVFGPLLVGDMLGSYAVKLADPSSGLFIVPRSPSSSKSQKGRKKAKESTEDHVQPPFLDVDKIHVANNITEMLVTNWRDVVRQMRSLDSSMGAIRSRSRSRSSISKDRPRHTSSFGRNSENDPHMMNRPERHAKDRPRSFEQHNEDDPKPYGRYVKDRHTNAGASGNRAVSFKHTYSPNDALSVSKTRPTSARNVSHGPPNSVQIRALSPPGEESSGEEQDNHASMRFPTPLKSSLKSSTSKRLPHLLVPKDHTSDEDVSRESSSTSLPPPTRSPYRVPRGISPIKKHCEDLEIHSRQRVSSPTYLSETGHSEYDQSCCREIPTRRETYRSGYNHTRPQSTAISAGPMSTVDCGTEYAGNEFSHRCTPTRVPSSTNDPRSTASRALTQADGSPERGTQQPSWDLYPSISYQAGPGVRILKVTSTMRSQPKMAHVDPKISTATLRSSVWRTSSRGSADSGDLSEDEPVEKASPGSKSKRAAPDQIDGAADFVVPVPSTPGSFIDRRGEFERREVKGSQTSPLPVFKKRSQPRAILIKKISPSKVSSWGSPNTSSPKSTLNGQAVVKPGVNKVMGLAAMFDTAAKASPFVPTPGGAVQRKRRETARVISPYTSNPSPRASLQSVTSVSTPVSLMCPTRLSIHLSTPVENNGKKTMISCLPNPNATCSNGKIERFMSPMSVLRRDESRISMTSSNNRSRLPSPSRPPDKKIPSIKSPPLPQFDGLNSTKPSLPRLTAQQEIRPIGLHSSPTLQPRVSGVDEDMLRLSQQGTSYICSEGTGHTSESTSLSPTPNGGRIASSLRDQIRILRAELSAKNEDCAQVRLDLEETLKVKEVNEILLREDLDRAKSDTQKWRRRAERAEMKVNKYERLAMRIEDTLDNGLSRCREQQGDTADDHSFMSGSAHLTASDCAASQPLMARMNQGVRRTPPDGVDGAKSAGPGDGFSECSSSTVVRTIASPDENGPITGSGLWSAVNELVDLAAPELWEETL